MLNHAIEVASQVAATAMTVLITGESGTGKESFSKIIHQLSARKHNAFIAVNCGAIPEGTIDSELFGHEKGAFTGAVDARKGYFEVTDGGTIFLDEVGEMPLGTQARLLRVLENGEYIRVGASKVQKTDVRVVAATNVNLLKAVEERKFREDLYYRLNTVPILVPPLRERGEDIYLLFRKFASDFSDRYHVDPVKLTKPAQEMLQKYRFPGNIRQLKNIVEQMSVLELDRELGPDKLVHYLPVYGQAGSTALQYQGAVGGGESSFSERDILFKILFDLRKDFNELKSLFIEVVKNPTNADQILNSHPDLFVPNAAVSVREVAAASPMLLPKATVPTADAGMGSSVSHEVEDISHAEEEENLSLMAGEKELIIKALKKHQGRRKPASEELGISERTLYRKLKEYDLEHL